MSRKDYVLIANVLQSELNATRDAAKRDALLGVVAEMSRALYRDNTRFDRERFAKACGL